MGKTPVPPIWPSSFVNTGFYEQQIFVKRDPFCFAQIPSMVSNGTHCFKNQQGVFNYDATKASLRIDYIKSYRGHPEHKHDENTFTTSKTLYIRPLQNMESCLRQSAHASHLVSARSLPAGRKMPFSWLVKNLESSSFGRNVSWTIASRVHTVWSDGDWKCGPHVPTVQWSRGV